MWLDFLVMADIVFESKERQLCVEIDPCLHNDPRDGDLATWYTNLYRCYFYFFNLGNFFYYYEPNIIHYFQIVKKINNTFHNIIL